MFLLWLTRDKTDTGRIKEATFDSEDKTERSFRSFLIVLDFADTPRLLYGLDFWFWLLFYNILCWRALLRPAALLMCLSGLCEPFWSDLWERSVFQPLKTRFWRTAEWVDPVAPCTTGLTGGVKNILSYTSPFFFRHEAFNETIVAICVWID